MIKIETALCVLCCLITCYIGWRVYVMTQSLQPMVNAADMVRWFLPR